MKINTITCSYAYNYGAVLQTYALSEYLKQKKHCVQVINYQPNYARKIKGKGIITNIVKPIVRMPDYIKGKKVFNKFLNQYVDLTREYKDINDLKKNVPEADAYVAGSDQIWNCDLPNGYDDSFFLDFVPNDRKKISYAASIAMNTLNQEQKNRFKDKLKDFDKISVREITGVKLLEGAEIKGVQKVLDPVFLLSKEQWQKLSHKEKREQEKYVLVYGFNGQKNVFEYATSIAKEKGCKVFSINTHIEDFLINKTDKYFWNASPEKFINLIENAEMVITNSFHGLAFSIIFNKNIKLFLKNGGANSRMLDVIKEFGIENIISTQNCNIDYQKVENNLKKLIKESYEFLENI